MKVRLNFMLAILIAGVVSFGCKKSDNPDPGGEAGSDAQLTLDGKKVEMKSAVHIYGGEFNGGHMHTISLLSIDENDIPNPSKSAQFEPFTSVSITFYTALVTLATVHILYTSVFGEQAKSITLEDGPSIQSAIFIPGASDFDKPGSNIQGQYYYASELDFNLVTSETTSEITLSGKLVPSSEYFVGNHANAIPFSANYKGSLMEQTIEQ